MKLAFLSSSTGWGGLERNLIRYAQWMQEAGHEVCLFTIPHAPITRAAEQSALTIQHIRRQRRHFPIFAALKLRKHLKNSAIDVLWVRDPRDLDLCSLSVRGTSTSLLFHQGMQIPKPKRAPWHRLRYGAVTAWVAPLDQLRFQTLHHTPVPAERIHVIPLALDLEWFETATASRQETRAQWNLPNDAKVVGLFGRFDALKGQETLIEALALPGGKDWHAFLIGENTRNQGNDHAKQLRDRCEHLGVSDRVHWHAPQDDLRSAYDACDAFAMCSASETIGMVTIEALVRGVPVVGTSTGGTAELLMNGKYGAVFEPGKSEQLAEQLAQHSQWPVPPPAYLERFQKSYALKKWSALLHDLRHPVA